MRRCSGVSMMAKTASFFKTTPTTSISVSSLSSRSHRRLTSVFPSDPYPLQLPTWGQTASLISSSIRRSVSTTSVVGDNSKKEDGAAASASWGDGGGGIGLHNVRDRVMLTARHSHDELYRYTTSQPKTCTIIGAPMTYGQPYIGTDEGPMLLRKAGLRQNLSALSWRVDDLADLDFGNLPSTNSQAKQTETTDSKLTPIQPDNAKNRWQVSAGTRVLAQTVEETLKQGRFPLILGGDHSIGIGSLAGILRAHPDTGILWIDAHADINTPAISESGNLHGMPVGLLMQDVVDRHTTSIPAFEWLYDYPQLKPHQIVYVGLRDVDVAERQIINDLGIVAYTMTEIDKYGIGKVMDMALEQHLTGRRLHVSYDIDVVDPVLAPATGTTVRGGLTFREALYVAEAIAATGRLASAEIVELNPTLSNVEGADNTVELGLQIITSLMGKSII